MVGRVPATEAKLARTRMGLSLLADGPCYRTPFGWFQEPTALSWDSTVGLELSLCLLLAFLLDSGMCFAHVAYAFPCFSAMRVADSSHGGSS